MVIVLRATGRKDQERHPLQVHLIGFILLVWLCIVSFLFGSTVGGSLIRSLCLVLVFSSSVAAFRGLCIGLGLWLERALDVTVFEYDSPEERRAIESVLKAMPGALVQAQPAYHTQGIWRLYLETYADGYKIAEITPDGYTNTCTEQLPCSCPPGCTEMPFVFNQEKIGTVFKYSKIFILVGLCASVVHFLGGGLYQGPWPWRIPLTGILVSIFAYQWHWGAFVEIAGMEGYVQPVSL